MTIQETILARWDELSDAAKKRIIATRAHMLNRWSCIDGDCGAVDTIEADSAEEALAAFAATYDRDMYPDDSGTIYVDIRVENIYTGEEDAQTLTLEDPEPECSDEDGHDWREWSTRGDGPGVRIRECCARCGEYRITRTQAQRRDTGEYVGEETSYKEADDESREWLSELRDEAKAVARAEIEAVLERAADIVRYRDGAYDVLTVVEQLRAGSAPNDVAEALRADLPDYDLTVIGERIEISSPDFE